MFKKSRLRDTKRVDYKTYGNSGKKVLKKQTYTVGGLQNVYGLQNVDTRYCSALSAISHIKLMKSHFISHQYYRQKKCNNYGAGLPFSFIGNHTM